MLVFYDALTNMKKNFLVRKFLTILSIIVSVQGFVSTHKSENIFICYVNFMLVTITGALFPSLLFNPEFSVKQTIQKQEFLLTLIVVIVLTSKIDFCIQLTAMVLNPAIYKPITAIAAFTSIISNFYFNFYSYMQTSNYFKHCFHCLVQFVPNYILDCAIQQKLAVFPKAGFVKQFGIGTITTVSHLFFNYQTIEILIIGTEIINIALKWNGMKQIWAVIAEWI
ncbi:Hypothetical_protein [Hexamita inflata]|uniref:Hypothetical_protein n=1 Tax=Hexamita inflata TaxID=28002 RepID=A0AA86QN43_9EUKA|nr:Hypothetical protein HINF_LOCUS47307 [Hexamita inflata]